MRNNKGRSLTPPEQLKSDYLEYRVREYKRFGLSVSHAYIAMKDFNLSASDFMDCKLKVVELIIRKYVYKMRGKYGNNRMV